MHQGADFFDPAGLPVRGALATGSEPSRDRNPDRAAAADDLRAVRPEFPPAPAHLTPIFEEKGETAVGKPRGLELIGAIPPGHEVAQTPSLDHDPLGLPFPSPEE